MKRAAVGEFNARRKYRCGNFSMCCCVCLPLQQTDDHNKDVGTILCLCAQKQREKSDGVVKRRFDCPLCSSPVRESTARLEDALMVDQFEVSECTLPGPSVADIPEDGVVASCHPPLVFKPCGLYIVFPPRASLYPAVRLITWRRVSTSKHVG